MMPKFKGDEENWLDDEERPSGQPLPKTRKKNIANRTTALPITEANAQVVEIFPNQCRIRMNQDQKIRLCHYRRAGVISPNKRERSPVAVGDRVKVTPIGAADGIIEGVCERKNALSRPAPGRDGTQIQHVLAANVDLLVIVASAHEPDFSLGIIDRFLVAAHAASIPTLICVTKIDLMDPSMSKPWSIYKPLNYAIVEVCSNTRVGIDALKQRILDQTVVFCGHSGVGKTSLLRILLQNETGKVGAVNTFTGKGKHTTTGAILLGGPGSSSWIDTPGIKAFSLSEIAPSTLSTYFPEFAVLNCPINQCQHLNEPGCQAHTQTRYTSYRKILESLLAGEG
jgi:ribosome biogenesis GTPase